MTDDPNRAKKPKKRKTTWDEKEMILANQKRREREKKVLTVDQCVALAFPSYFLYRCLESIQNSHPEIVVREDILHALNLSATVPFKHLGEDQFAIRTAGAKIEEKVRALVRDLSTEIRHTTLGWCLATMRMAEKGMLYEVDDQSVIASAAIWEEAEAEAWRMWDYRKGVVRDTADKMENRFRMLGLSADRDKRSLLFPPIDRADRQG